ncbi:MAG: gliding motility-associated ABC transporter substrate-binding protein GldG [Bacteroidales bacterium]|nr:gliding motility-associated ABC transporter substrate-binding protein GldG [Bacteroidales bacterium]
MEKASNNSQRFKKNAITSLIVGFIILIAINILSSFLFFRLDLTKDKRLSLSSTTIQMLKSIDDPIYIRVYMEGDGLPADYQLFKEKTKDILQEFRSYSKNVHFELIDPIKDKTPEEANAIFGEFNQKGLKPIPISKEDASGYSTRFVIPGAMISFRDKEYPAELIVADPSGNDWLEYSIQELEYNLVSSIRKLITGSKPKVAFLDGHGEMDFYSTSWMAWQLQRFYNIDRVRINGRVNALNDIAVKDSVSKELVINGNKYDVLIVAQPTEPFPDADKYVIDQFLMRGGKILWLIDATTASADSLQDTPEFFATPRNLQLNDLFFSYGVRLNPNLVQDLSCQQIPIGVGTIGDQQQYKFMNFPYCLKVVNFSEHPIVRNIKEIKSDFTGTIDFVGKEVNLEKTVLMTTSERTKMVPTPAIVTINVGLAQPNLQEYAFKYLPIAALVEGRFQSAFDGILPIEFDTMKALGYLHESEPTRQIFIADGDIIRNFIDRQHNQPYPTGYDIYTGEMYDNTNFLLNCVNYLCDDDDLLQIRSKNFKIGSLDPVKIRNHKNLYSILNIAIPLVLIFIMGIILIIIRKSKYSRK